MGKLYGDLWNVPFKESLKVEVKDRDDWKCVIACETDLHVHHKIPRKLGAYYHKDNLVTLCKLPA
ncbi:HNH endonuclease [Bacillus cereus]